MKFSPHLTTSPDASKCSRGTKPESFGASSSTRGFGSGFFAATAVRGGGDGDGGDGDGEGGDSYARRSTTGVADESRDSENLLLAPSR